MKLIDKDALVAEINKRIIDAPINNIGHQRVWAYNDVKDIINTLEVKEVKEPNASDRGTAEEIIINLKRVEHDYRIDLTKEIEWVRNQVQKGSKGMTEIKAGKDNELTWEDLALIEKIGKDFIKENDTPMTDEEFFEAVLKRYKIERKNENNQDTAGAGHEG